MQQQLQGSDNYIWSLGECLGQGASAAVYRGRHKRTGILCAVKVFKNDGRFRPETWANELQLLNGLDHRNVIKVMAIEIESAMKSKVLVMELCTSSVWGMLEDPKYAKGFPEEEFITVVKDVAEGMRYLRTNNIVHRDIKPGNIMRVLDIDNKSIYKLADFGAARTLDDGDNFMSLCGTEEYLHPDLYARAVLHQTNVQQFSVSVDLWSLGATLYHIATGELPFKPFGGRINANIMHQMTNNKQSGVIAASQRVEGGRIIWHTELPETCLLSPCLKKLLVPMFAGLLENNNELMWIYEKFFAFMDNLKERLNMRVYDVTYAVNRLLYIAPQCTLASLQELIAENTEISVANQIIVNINGVPLSEFVFPSETVSKYPPYVMKAQFFVYSRCKVDRMPSEVIDLPQRPNFQSIFQYQRDYEISVECCALSQFTKSVVVTTVESQQLLCDSIYAFIQYVVRVIERTSENSSQLKKEFTDTDQRVLVMVTSDGFTQAIMQLLNHSTDDSKLYMEQIVKLIEKCKLLSIDGVRERLNMLELNLRNNKQEFVSIQNTGDLYKKSCRHQDKSCSGQVDHQQEWITKISSRFRRDKNAVSHSYNDEQIHKMERLKLKERLEKIYDVYIQHCRQNLITLHCESYEPIRRLCAFSIKIDAQAQTILNERTELQNFANQMSIIEKVYIDVRDQLLRSITDTYLNASALPILTVLQFDTRPSPQTDVVTENEISEDTKYICKNLMKALHEAKQSVQSKGLLLRKLSESIIPTNA